MDKELERIRNLVHTENHGIRTPEEVGKMTAAELQGYTSHIDCVNCHKYARSLPHYIDPSFIPEHTYCISCSAFFAEELNRFTTDTKPDVKKDPTWGGAFE